MMNDLKMASDFTLGRYQVVRRIGRGGMGEVWLCEDPRLKRQVAIKILPPQNQQDLEFVRRFEREAQAAAALTHPHILQVHDYGKQSLPDGAVMPYIVMPYIEGGSLSERMLSYRRQRMPMPPQEALNFLRQAASAIDYAHQKQIIHRDIKPANMLLHGNDWLLLADFGIARILSNPRRGGANSSVTQKGYGFGTPEYMAPEQAQGRASITSDNYSLAVIAYQLFTGQLPFQGETAIATTMQHLTDQPPPPRQLANWLPLPFEQVLLRGLAKDPEQRPALASEFVEQLAQTLSNRMHPSAEIRTLKDVPELNVQERSDQEEQVHETGPVNWFSRRNLLTGAGLTAALLAGGGAATWAYLRNRNATPPLPPLPSPSARPQPHGGKFPELQLTGAHNQQPTSLYWSPDSRSLFSCGFDAQIFRWDIPGLMQNPEKQPFYSGEPLISSNSDMQLDISPDGKKIVVSNFRALENDAVNQLAITTPDLKLLSRITVDDAPAYFFPFWLPDNYLVVGTGAQAFTDRAATDKQQKIYVIDSQQPQRRWIVKEHDGSDGDYLASLTLYRSASPPRIALAFKYTVEIGTITIADQPSWHVLARFNLVPNGTTGSSGLDPIRSIGWSADGKTLIALLRINGSTKLVSVDWQANNPKPVELALPRMDRGDYGWNIVNNPATAPSAIAMNSWLGHIYLLDRSGAQTGRLEHNSMKSSDPLFFDLAWSPDGKWLAASCEDNKLSILVWKL